MAKIFFLDIDGTIIDVPRGLDKPSKYTIYAIKELMKNGNYVFIASGRFKVSLYKSIIDLNPSGYILSNGAYAELFGKELFSTTVPESTFLKINDYCLKNNILFLCEKQDYVFAPLKSDNAKEFIKRWHFEEIKFVNEDKDHKYYMFIIEFKDKASLDNFSFLFKKDVDLRKQLIDDVYLTYDASQYGVNKGTGVINVLNMLNLSKEDTYCFCDGLNDLELVETCKYSYVMKNGAEELKKIAYGIADDVINDGVYKKLVELKFIEPYHE